MMVTIITMSILMTLITIILSTLHIMITTNITSIIISIVDIIVIVIGIVTMIMDNNILNCLELNLHQPDSSSKHRWLALHLRNSDARTLPKAVLLVLCME